MVSLCSIFATGEQAVAQYDSLSEIRAAVSAMMNTNVSDADLNIIINMAAWDVQAQLKSVIRVDTIPLTSGTLRYELNSDMMNGDASGVIWRRTYSGEDIYLARMRYVGTPDVGPIPAVYWIEGNMILLTGQGGKGDTLFVFYPVLATEMGADTDTGDLATADDPAVIFLSLSFLASKKNMSDTRDYWYRVFAEYRSARRGQGAPQQEQQ